MRLGSRNRGGWDWNWRDRGRNGGEGGGQQQRLMLPWKRVYASLMHLVDPIRGWLCLHRRMRVCSGVNHAHTHAHACLPGAFAHKILKSWILLLQNGIFVADLGARAHSIWPVCKCNVFCPRLSVKKNGQEWWKGLIRSHAGRYSLGKPGYLSDRSAQWLAPCQCLASGPRKLPLFPHALTPGRIAIAGSVRRVMVKWCVWWWNEGLQIRWDYTWGGKK